MTTSQLQLEIAKLKAYKAERVRLGEAVVVHDLLTPLIESIRPDHPAAHQAAWVLEQSYLLHEESCYPHLAAITKAFTYELNSSAMRSLTNLGDRMTKKYYGKRPHALQELLTLEMREQILDGCFRQIILPSDKTANLAYATRAVFELGKEFDWVHAELSVAIRTQLQNTPTRGYIPCGNGILRKLKAKGIG